VSGPSCGIGIRGSGYHRKTFRLTKFGRSSPRHQGAFRGMASAHRFVIPGIRQNPETTRRPRISNIHPLEKKRGGGGVGCQRS